MGGSALALLGVTTRQTRDFDILAPKLPPAIADAARDFAREQRRLGVELLDDWLNNGPMQLGDVLPEGWKQRLQAAFEGQVLILKSLSRTDLLKTKLFALCDRGTDLPDWPAHVRATIVELQRRLGHGV